MADSSAEAHKPEQNQAEEVPAGARVSELETQLRDEKNRYLYLYAEFENFKKRALKERSDAIKFGWEPVARELLEVLDNLERALDHMPAETSKTLVEGLRLVANQFRATLEKQGVQKIDSRGQAFDPHLHEAVGQEPSESPEGTVTQEALRGYTLHGRLLRPSRVVISSGGKGKSSGQA